MRISRAVALLMAALALPAVAPAIVVAHALDASFESRLPLVAYLAGAAGAVALSFVFVLLRPRDPDSTEPATDGIEVDQTLAVPRWLRLGLRGLGLVAFIWIAAQGIIGGSSDADVVTLFLWVYGWVGVALVSAFVGPVWTWLDPFVTLYDIGAWLLRGGRTTRSDRTTSDPAPTNLAPSIGRWPAVAGFSLFIWLELALGGGGSILFAMVAAYTVVTLAGMALYGRDTWRRQGEAFSAWFGILGRLAPLALDEGSDATRVRPRGFASGVLDPGWTTADLVLIALGVGSILFDGLSQTQIFFDLFGAPAPLAMTAILAGSLALVAGLARVAARWVGLAAACAGLLPIAVGYLAAHYLTLLLIDGQRIVVAISDPFQQGWNLFGTAFFEPSAGWIPPGLVWTFQLLMVVGGHMIGAWAGHATADDGRPSTGRLPASRARQLPLAAVMVVLTTVTLWSLGQAVVRPPADEPPAAGASSSESA